MAKSKSYLKVQKYLENQRKLRRQIQPRDTADRNLQLYFGYTNQYADLKQRRDLVIELANEKLEEAKKQRAAFEQDLRQEVQAQEISAYEEKRAAEKWKERQQRESFVADSIIERGRQDMKTPTLTPSIQNDIFWMA